MDAWLLEIDNDGFEYTVIDKTSIDYIFTGNQSEDFINNYISYTKVNSTQAFEETYCDNEDERKLIVVPSLFNGVKAKFSKDLQSIQEFVILNKLHLIGKVKGSF